MKSFFVTGTDTHVGKTVTSAALLLATQGCYWKPVQTGDPDDENVKQLTQLPAEHFKPSVYTFKMPASPHFAAAAEGITIDASHFKLPETTKTLIVEGAGGVKAPLNADILMIDLIRMLTVPVIIVSRGTLGTINHTLLTIEALRHRQIPIHGIVFSGEFNPANQNAIEQYGQVRTLFHIPLIQPFHTASFQAWVASEKQTLREALQCA